MHTAMRPERARASTSSAYGFWAPPTVTEYGPVLALDDVIGTKVRALADRGAVRDFIDVHAVTRHRATADLENLGRRHARFEFSLHDLHDRMVDPTRSSRP